MRKATIAASIVTVILVASTVICGLWLRFSGEEIGESDRNFHLAIGLASAVGASITMVLALMRRKS